MVPLDQNLERGSLEDVMASSIGRRITEAETGANPSGKRCAKCLRVKACDPTDPTHSQFWFRSNGKPHSYCKVCKQLIVAAWKRENGFKRSPESRVQHREYQAQYRRTPAGKDANRRYKRSPIGKLIDYRGWVRRRIRIAPTGYLYAKEAELTWEIERIRAQRRE